MPRECDEGDRDREGEEVVEELADGDRGIENAQEARLRTTT